MNLKPPSVKAEERAKEQTRILEEKKQQEEHLRGIFGRTFSTPDGIETLKWLARECRFGKPIPITDDRSMHLMTIKHNLYTEIRRHLPFETLKEAEYE